VKYKAKYFVQKNVENKMEKREKDCYCLKQKFLSVQTV
jgi:hypothetical protein